MDVLYSDFEVYYRQNPLPHLPKEAGDMDIFVAQEFFSPQPRMSLFLARATPRTVLSLGNLASWFLRFPFGTETPGVRSPARQLRFGWCHVPRVLPSRRGFRSFRRFQGLWCA